MDERLTYRWSEAPLVHFWGLTRSILLELPAPIRHEFAYQLAVLQYGCTKAGSKSINAARMRMSFGSSTFELRVVPPGQGACVLRVAVRDNIVQVLHCNWPNTVAVTATPRPSYVRCVCEALEPDFADALCLKLRTTLMIALIDDLYMAGHDQATAARLLGVSQPRISDLMRGKIRQFGLETLVSMVAKRGLSVEMKLVPRLPRSA